jgi:hypothetical protein
MGHRPFPAPLNVTSSAREVVGYTKVYTLAIHPYHRGATDQEVAMALPGDSAMPADAAVSTRAITIHAPAATVWAWLAQTGQISWWRLA